MICMLPGNPGVRGHEEGMESIRALVAILRQLARLLDAMTDAQYQARPVGAVPSSVGSHVRHCLDHVDALLHGAATGHIDYDQRQRGTAVETSRTAALEALCRQEQQLRDLPPEASLWPLRLTALVSPSAPPVTVTSSVGRELVFVLSHTIHHNALIAVMSRTLGVPTPERFGYAPATLAYQERTTCVR